MRYFGFFFQFYFNEDYIFLKTSFSTCCDLQMNVRMQMLIYFQLCIRWVSLYLEVVFSLCVGTNEIMKLIISRNLLST